MGHDIGGLAAEGGREGGRGGSVVMKIFSREVGRYGCQNDGLDELAE